VTGIREPDMLTGMTERDWSVVLEVFDAAQSSRGEPGHDDRKFLEAVHYFAIHSITWRALPSEYGKWNSVWKRFWRLSRSGVFEALFQMLAECSLNRPGFAGGSNSLARLWPFGGDHAAWQSA
jgi:transposase